MAIPVVALEPGFYGYYRAKGERFDIQSLTDLGDWMSLSDDVSSGGGDGFGLAIIPNEGVMPLVPVKYSKKHTGGGSFVVVDFLGNQIGPVIPRSTDPKSANITAQLYADQLNAGASPDQVFN